MDCRIVLNLLPDYVAGRYVPDRDRIAGHLSRCEACDGSRRELEAVFALLAEVTEPPESLYGEANTRLALQSEFGPGPLRAEAEDRCREDARFRVCASASACGMMAFTGGAAYIWKTPGVGAQMMEWADGGFSQLMHAGSLWPVAALFFLMSLMGGTAALLPALISNDRSAASSRRARREV
ncbi:MAG: hypothetical protein KY468_17885 [Armatimonadetes bacterium]|nr:hypothetical protein [Armatimonadota bacterium]